APHLAHLSFSDAEYRLVGSQVVHLDLDTPRLQILECVGAPVLFSGRAYPSVRAVSFDLERNQFQCPSFADLLRYFPNAVSVDIGWYDERFNPHANSTRLVEATHLETLTVKGEDCFFPYNLARCLSFPSLRQASVKYLSPRPGIVLHSAAVTVFIGSALRTLEHLTLHAYSHDAGAGVDLITALSTPPSNTHTSWLCPWLQTLTLHICPDFAGALLNLATKRAASASESAPGQRLTKISVFLKELNAVGLYVWRVTGTTHRHDVEMSSRCCPPVLPNSSTSGGRGTSNPLAGRATTVTESVDVRSTTHHHVHGYFQLQVAALDEWSVSRDSDDASGCQLRVGPHFVNRTEYSTYVAIVILQLVAHALTYEGNSV
ncbi:hypothetical protein EXIGLDRAFT_692609, partial [Exidia glandulosa HHB12029]